jgi:hypothetical protein
MKNETGNQRVEVALPNLRRDAGRLVLFTLSFLDIVRSCSTPS